MNLTYQMNITGATTVYITYSSHPSVSHSNGKKKIRMANSKIEFIFELKLLGNVRMDDKP